MLLEEKVDKLIEEVAAIRTALKYNGIGLIPSFEQHCIQDREFRADYFRFKRWCIGLVCFLVGSGVITIGALRILGG